tara:strand:- start:591 stop:785 length:195 start_codon:yes stop_codon:yes gene_type:complete
MNAAAKKTNLKSNQSEVNILRKSLLNLKFQKSTGQLEKTSEINKIRKKIAKLKTEINKTKDNHA